MKISCLMVSKPGREAMAREAIDCFCAQTHADRQLIVLVTSEECEDAMQEHAAVAAGRCEVKQDIRVIVEDEAPLGRLRNITMDHAAGDVICQWDDDDLHHPERLACQLALMRTSGRGSCFMVSQCYQSVFDVPTTLCVVDWTLRPTQGSGILIPGTLMCYKRGVRYLDDLASGEDTRFLQGQIKHTGPSAIVNRPGLYVRRFHGDNTTMPAKIQANLRNRSWGKDRLEPRLAELRDDLRAFRSYLGDRARFVAAVGKTYNTVDSRTFELDLT